MAHTFLSIDLSLIKANIRSNQNSFGLLSNDGSRALIDGYNKKREFVCDAGFKQWIKIPEHAQADASLIISTAIEYTYDEIKVLQSDVNSIWYVDQEGLI
mgnify:CR=1 FL=1|tara:strand:- start:2391 stop:2690 length:300 start_codon:yes stop_codon:yes gene_type:complete